MDYITGDNFFDVLDNGVIVCRLARVIQEKARSAIESGRAKGVSVLSFIKLFLQLFYISALASVIFIKSFNSILLNAMWQLLKSLKKYDRKIYFAVMIKNFELSICKKHVNCRRYQWYEVAVGRMLRAAASFPATTWRTLYNSVGDWASTRIFSSKATISVKPRAINFNACELNRGGTRAVIRSIGCLSHGREFKCVSWWMIISGKNSNWPAQISDARVGMYTA